MLSKFIEKQRERILEDWVAYARTAAACSEEMDLAALRDHALEMLDAIIADLDTPQTQWQEKEKSGGKSDASTLSAAAFTAAQFHGAGRARSGFNVQQMISEYRSLRASVLRLWFEEPGRLHTSDSRDMSRFNESIDQALAESAASYAQVIEEAMQDAYTELERRVVERTHDLARANERLREEITERQRSEDLRIRLLQQLLHAQEDEQRRISRELHDQLGQLVTAMGLRVARISGRSDLGSDLRAEIAALASITRNLDTDVDFIVWQLRPTALDDLGLAEALHDYVASWSSHFGVEARCVVTGMHERLSVELETVLYRITQEALNNVAKHARAQHVSVTLHHDSSETLLTITDDGVGFDVDSQRQAGSPKGLGLDGMGERAALVEGNLRISAKPGQGTAILITVPRSGEHT